MFGRVACVYPADLSAIAEPQDPPIDNFMLFGNVDLQILRLLSCEGSCWVGEEGSYKLPQSKGDYFVNSSSSKLALPTYRQTDTHTYVHTQAQTLNRYG